MRKDPCELQGILEQMEECLSYEKVVLHENPCAYQQDWVDNITVLISDLKEEIAKDSAKTEPTSSNP